MTSLLKVLGLGQAPTRLGHERGPDRLADLIEDDAADEALRLVELQTRLDQLARTPLGAVDDEVQVLVAARGHAQSTLSARDIVLAGRAIDEVQALRDDVAASIRLRRSARKNDLAAQLRVAVDPGGLDELAVDPIAPLREAAEKHLAADDLDAAEVTIGDLSLAIAKARDAIDEFIVERSSELRGELQQLAPPKGAEGQELETLLTMAQDVAGSIDARKPRDAAGKLEQLRVAHRKISEAIAERIRKQTEELMGRVKSIAIPPSASHDERLPVATLIEQANAAIGEGGLNSARNLIIQAVRAQQKLARALKRKEQAPLEGKGKRKDDDSDAKGKHENAARLREWVQEHIYTPNGEIAQNGGLLQETPVADKVWDAEDGYTDEDYAKQLLELEKESKKFTEGQQLLTRIKAARSLLSARVAALKKALDEFDAKLKTVIQGVATQVDRAGLGKEAKPFVQKLLDVKLKELAGLKAKLDLVFKATQPLEKVELVCDAKQLAQIESAEKILAANDPAQLNAKILELRTGLVVPTEDPVKLIDLGKSWIGKGLHHAKIMKVLSHSRGAKLPLAVVDARLQFSFDEQILIASTDLHILELPAASGTLYVKALGDCNNAPCHLSLYKSAFKAGCKWTDAIDAIVDAMVGKVADQGLHVTWEWTGKKDHDENVKVYRYASAGPKGFQTYRVWRYWKPEDHDGKSFERDDFGVVTVTRPGPSPQAAVATLFAKLEDEIELIKEKLELYRTRKGLTQEQFDANTVDKIAFG